MTPTLEQIIVWTFCGLLVAGVIAAILEVVFGVSFSGPDTEPGILGRLFTWFLMGNPSTPQRPDGAHIDDFVAWHQSFTDEPLAAVFHVVDGQSEYWTADPGEAPHYTQSVNGRLTGSIITGIGTIAQGGAQAGGLNSKTIAREWNRNKEQNE